MDVATLAAAKRTLTYFYGTFVLDTFTKKIIIDRQR